MDVVTISTRIPKVTEYTVVRAIQNNVLTASSSLQAPTYYFALNSANVGTGFFDMYRIAAIRFNIRPQQNAIGLTTNSTTTVTSIYCVIDYDDDASLGSIAAAESYSNCLVLPPGQSCSRTFKPRVAVSAYTGSFNGYTNMADPWIDAASTNVRHYGIKIVIPSITVAQTQLQSWDLSSEYFIELLKAI